MDGIIIDIMVDSFISHCSFFPVLLGSCCEWQSEAATAPEKKRLSDRGGRSRTRFATQESARTGVNECSLITRGLLLDYLPRRTHSVVWRCWLPGRCCCSWPAADPIDEGSET